MKKQENRESNNQQSVIEDLAVDEDHSADVKGGIDPGKTIRFKAGKELPE